MSTASILTGFIISTIGFSVFLYGKKQQRLPQLFSGIVLMVLPFAFPQPFWMIAAAILSLAALEAALNLGL